MKMRKTEMNPLSESPSSLVISLFLVLIFSATPSSSSSSSSAEASSPAPASTDAIDSVCIIGSGIAGSSVAHFLRKYSSDQSIEVKEIRIFERNGIVGGRMATVSIGGDTFEAGASIIHPKNLHALNFTKMLNLKIKEPSSLDSPSFGIWDGKHFIYKTLSPTFDLPFVDKIYSLLNSVVMFVRYGFSLLRMQSFIENAVGCFSKYYMGFESRPVFETVEEMLKWANLYGLTRRSLEEELADAGIGPKLISELITVITRINYGQSTRISGLAGAVSLAGSDEGLWAVEGGNWQIDAGLIKRSDVILHLSEEIESVSYIGGSYELNSTEGNSYSCKVTVVATPLDEVDIHFSPPISIPKRNLQHTHATFVRGVLNPVYFGLKSILEVPELVGTIETPNIPFSSISVLKKHSNEDFTYKVFSRAPMEDALLDQMFSMRNETIRINWGAYPHFKAPEEFAPFLLDRLQLYYINAFENAASTIETSAVAAENVARLILSRYSRRASAGPSYLRNFASNEQVHQDL